jgi:hypothetical protein
MQSLQRDLTRPRWRYLAYLSGAVAVVGLGWWLFPTDARRVRAACHELAVSLSAPAQEPDVGRLARLTQFAKHLALDVSVEAEGVDARLEGRDQVMAAVGQLRASQGGVTVTLDEVTVAIREGRRSADVTALASVREPGVDGGPDTVEERRVVMEWVAAEGGWQLARAIVMLPGQTGAPPEP